MIKKKYFLLIWLVFSLTGYGNIYLSKSRVIVNEKDNEATIRVKNVDQSSVLLQIWIDNGDLNADVSTIKVPFVIYKPIIKLEGKNSDQIRVLYTGSNIKLPTDKESVFWLNVLEVNARSANEPLKKIQLAFRTRIKLFYRPASLKDLDTDNINKSLLFKLKNKKSGQQIIVHNPTPVYQTFLSANLEKNPMVNLINDQDMIAPFSNVSWQNNSKVRIRVGDIIDYKTIDDYSAESSVSKAIEF